MAAAAPARVAGLAVAGVSRTYDGQLALDAVDFRVEAGEIHALLGANGAGKSTLIKILAGVVVRDDGEVRVGDAALARRFSAAEAQAAGMAFVHQNVGLVDALSVTDNVGLRLGYAKRGRVISYPQTRERVLEVLTAVGVAVDPDALVESLSQAEKVMVALACAMATEATLLVLDEISASLPGPDVARIESMLRVIRDRGVAIVFVTHRIAEVFSLADRVTVLRDGRRIATAAVEEVDEAQVVEWIAGAAVSLEGLRAVEPPAAAADDAGIVRVDGLCCDGLAEPVSFAIRPGEVLALAGLVGSGAQRVTQALAGAATGVSGELTVEGKRIACDRPQRMVDRGISYVPGDRQRAGVFGLLHVRENLFVARSARAGDPALRLPGKERRLARELIERLRVVPQDVVDVPVAALSGGNQQKIVLGRALRTQPRLLILEDPTAGVDVGARAELLRLIRAQAEAGACVLLASSDYEEVTTVADRAIVFAEGRVSAELPRERLTEAQLVRASFGYAPETEEHGDGSGTQPTRD
jgi:ribose transport system ATP-binding protein